MKQQKPGSKNILYLKFKSIAVLFFGAAILFYACENDIEQIKAFSAPENLPTLEATNFETLFTDSGEVRFYLKTPKLLQYENDGKSYHEFPQGMELIKYDANKKVISSITANYAKRFLQEDKWEAKNNVIAINAKGDTLKTEHLIWEVKEEKIYTEEFVKIIREDEIITGIGFESDQTLENWKIKNPKGTIYVSVENNKNANSDSINAATLPVEGKVQPFKNPLEFKK